MKKTCYDKIIEPRLGISPDYYNSVKANGWPAFENLVNLNWNDFDQDLKHRHWYEPSYHPSLYPLVRHSFPGMHQIDRSYSQSLQDIFILTFLDGKRNGKYLEIGCYHPTKINNTKLLAEFGWSGISIDWWPDAKMLWKNSRPDSSFILADARKIDYNKLLDDYMMPDRIDFLQTDIDSKNSALLLKVLQTERKFSVIMFEHDLYDGNQDEKVQSTQILENYGYKRIIENVCCKDFGTDQFVAFEDWWIDPTVIDSNIADKFFNVGKDQVHPLNLLCKPGSIDDIMEPVWNQKDIWKPE